MLTNFIRSRLKVAEPLKEAKKLPADRVGSDRNALKIDHVLEEFRSQASKLIEMQLECTHKLKRSWEATKEKSAEAESKDIDLKDFDVDIKDLQNYKISIDNQKRKKYSQRLGRSGNSGINNFMTVTSSSPGS
jgi:hypothetical protein